MRYTIDSGQIIDALFSQPEIAGKRYPVLWASEQCITCRGISIIQTDRVRCNICHCDGGSCTRQNIARPYRHPGKPGGLRKSYQTTGFFPAEVEGKTIES